MNGLILINKPRDQTSHDIILALRKILSFQKIGHFGTLDPFATGLLLAAVGRATKFFPFYSKMDKVYQGRIRLGQATDTYDSTGTPLSPEHHEYPDVEKVGKAMARFIGNIEQLPPPYSAKKFRGKPLYKLARAKKETPLRSFKVTIHYFVLKKYDPPYLDFELKCSSGTYVRSLAHDLGRFLGCGGHLLELVRTEVGKFRIQDSLTIRDIEESMAQDRLGDVLIPLESLLPHLAGFALNEAGTLLVKNGNTVHSGHIRNIIAPQLPEGSPAPPEEAVFKLFGTNGKLLALARPGHQPDSYSPFLVVS